MPQDTGKRPVYGPTPSYYDTPPSSPDTWNPWISFYGDAENGAPEGREDAETFRKDAATQTDPHLPPSYESPDGLLPSDGLLPPDSQEFLPPTPPPEDDYSFLPPTPPPEDDYSVLDKLFPDDVLQEEETPEVFVPDTPPARGTKRKMSKDKEEAPPREFGRTPKKRKTPSYK